MGLRRVLDADLVVKVLLGTTGALLCWAFLAPVYAGDHRHVTQCLSNVKQTSLSVIMYASDFDENLPPVDAWYDATFPYRKAKLTCPELKEGVGYAMNDSLRGWKTHAERWAMVFESTKLEPNAHDPLTSLLEEPRHGYVPVGFGDGHAKSFKLVEGTTILEQVVASTRP